MSVAQQIFQSPTQNQSSVQNNLQKPKLLLRTYNRVRAFISFVIFFIIIILALILATPMGILYKLSYRGHEMHGLKPFCTPYESEYGHHKRVKDGNTRSAFSKN